MDLRYFQKHMFICFLFKSAFVLFCWFFDKEIPSKLWEITSIKMYIFQQWFCDYRYSYVRHIYFWFRLYSWDLCSCAKVNVCWTLIDYGNIVLIINPRDGSGISNYNGSPLNMLRYVWLHHGAIYEDALIVCLHRFSGLML